MTLIYKKGNLLDSDCQALVNTVNCVGVMGKGIALQFKQRYPEMFRGYKLACQNKLIDIGVLHTYRADNKLIVNFPTKKHWRNPSQYEWIQDGLEQLENLIEEENIRSIALPKLGCGNGGLNWGIIDNMIVVWESMLKMNVRVEVYH